MDWETKGVIIIILYTIIFCLGVWKLIDLVNSI